MKSIGLVQVALVGFAAVACGLSEIGSFEMDDKNGIWTGPSAGGPVLSQSITYVTAFDYPEGYDWRSDSEKGCVRCSLTVFASGRAILKIPVGDIYNVSSDPDMHRMIDGHLYTDYATDSETVIKKDGKPFITFKGRESIAAMHVRGDSLHTLGQKRDGRGFSYRVDGEVILERNIGYAFPNLMVDDSGISFAFAEPITSSADGIERYYIYHNATVSQVALREDVKKVWDVTVHCGEVFYLASLIGIEEPVVVTDKSLEALTLPFETSLVAGQFFSAGDELCVEMILSSGAALSSALWRQNRLYWYSNQGMTVSSIWAGKEGIACVLNPTSQDKGSAVFRMGEYELLPEGYTAIGSSPIVVSNGILTVGLSSLSGSKPILWMDGEIDELDVNGYICTVSSVSR